jgi:hypothetical protein
MQLPCRSGDQQGASPTGGVISFAAAAASVLRVARAVAASARSRAGPANAHIAFCAACAASARSWPYGKLCFPSANSRQLRVADHGCGSRLRNGSHGRRVFVRGVACRVAEAFGQIEPLPAQHGPLMGPHAAAAIAYETATGQTASGTVLSVALVHE